MRECNDLAVPEGDFMAAFCIRCFQPECSRSQDGKSKFDHRVATWAERLFLNVPKLDTSDPRYGKLSAQKFITIDTGRVPEVGWVDPLEPQAAPREDPPPPPEVPQAPGVARVAVPGHLALANAPSQAGKVLGSGGQSARRDAWAVPEKSAEPVVAPGSRIKLGGSGV
jgi:hypothetical protein